MVSCIQKIKQIHAFFLLQLIRPENLSSQNTLLFWATT